jgi:hypothetical protein
MVRTHQRIILYLNTKTPKYVASFRSKAKILSATDTMKCNMQGTRWQCYMRHSHPRKRCMKDAMSSQWNIFLPLQCCTCFIVLLNALHDWNYVALPWRSILPHNARYQQTPPPTTPILTDPSQPLSTPPFLSPKHGQNGQILHREQPMHLHTKLSTFKIWYIHCVLPAWR